MKKNVREPLKNLDFSEVTKLYQAIQRHSTSENSAAIFDVLNTTWY